MQKIIDFIKGLFGKKSTKSESTDSSGFTLIELLIVIAVIGILAAALLAAIDPIDKVKQGRDTKVINDVRSIYDGANRVYTNYGTWPIGATGALQIADIVTKGELKNAPVHPVTGSVYNMATNVDSVVVWSPVFSKVNRCKAGSTNCGVAVNFVLTSTGGCYLVATTTPTAVYTCPVTAVP